MDLGLKGKAAFITGGSMGIGKAIAEVLSSEGVSVAIAARSMDALQGAAREVQAKTGGAVMAVQTDVTSMASVQQAIDACAAKFGRLDILVNGAAAPGGLVRAELEEASDEGLLQDLDIKVVGYFRCAKAAAPHMKKNRFGRIVNIGGLTGRGSKQLSGMRNVAVVHMTKCLSDQLGPDGITVNTIHPGVVDTEHIQDLYRNEARKQGLTPQQVKTNYENATPIRRVLGAEEMGWLVAFLSSPKASSITGESIGIDGGITRGIFL